jgi:hypothetical protein
VCMCVDGVTIGSILSSPLLSGLWSSMFLTVGSETEVTFVSHVLVVL